MTLQLKCEWCRETIADGGRVADQKTAYYEHRAACKPQHKGHQLFKGENTMSGYIPTEDEVETAFSTFAAELAIEFPGEYPEAPEFATIKGASAGFYRYLNQVKADAWAEGWSEGFGNARDEFDALSIGDNPYRKQEEA